MERDALCLAAVDLEQLSDAALAGEIEKRQGILDSWEERYREMCIPMAHGIRLFGQLYNDRLRPGDPFAFLGLLAGDTGLLAAERNRTLQELADLLRSDPPLTARLRDGSPPDSGSPFAAALAGFTSRFGDLSWVMGETAEGSRGLISLLLELAKSPPAQQTVRKQADEAEYLARFTMEEQDFAHEALEIGRASYRLRDNDNLSIGRLTARLREARAEATRRLAAHDNPEPAARTGTGPGARCQAPHSCRFRRREWWNPSGNTSAGPPDCGAAGRSRSGAGIVPASSANRLTCERFSPAKFSSAMRSIRT